MEVLPLHPLHFHPFNLIFTVIILWLASACGACQVFKCGKYIFGYPFGLKNSGCGDPALQLDCDYEEQKPLLNISGHQYYVRDPHTYFMPSNKLVNDSHHYMTLIDRNLKGDKCNPSLMNHTAQFWSNPQFRFRDGYQNLTLLQRCAPETIRNWSPLPCNRSWQYSSKFDSAFDSKSSCSVGGVALVAAVVLFYILYVRRRKPPPTRGLDNDFRDYHRSDMEAGRPRYILGSLSIFSYQELEQATNLFDEENELGDGGFGAVYLGKLQDGRIVAVKRFYQENSRRVEQFINEVQILSSLSHQSLVRLYGCTNPESPMLLLVYEYLSNGTLWDHLHGCRRTPRGLPWGTRLNIAIEIAQALAYLHSIDPPIFHRDVKSLNILLDENFRAKVADFGLSRLAPVNVSHITTAPQGTPGYVDPEYHQRFQLTDKSDVYSFGVVLVELISAKVAVDTGRNNNEISLAYMAIDKIRTGALG
ncbi:hypothetical protein KI387_010724 [Taxus chinensis]|uniref:Protein kinase domain-containing protein n=1 Tax=Taxus chinensis TaxID=29808 RepID=A0AA38KVX5_TAXCH|nr:hypothetical protein KI387_010724 [Taxus chinensis]